MSCPPPALSLLSYDSDVDRECKIDFKQLTYSSPLREADGEHVSRAPPALGERAWAWVDLAPARSSLSCAFVLLLLLTGGVRPDKKSTATKRKSRFGKKASKPGGSVVHRGASPFRQFGPRVRKSLVNHAPYFHADGVKGLRLEHIHGYRGFDARNNVRYVDKGELTAVAQAREAPERRAHVGSTEAKATRSCPCS